VSAVTTPPAVSSSSLTTSATAGRRKASGQAFYVLCLAAISIAMLALVVLLLDILLDGLPALNWGFITSYPSRFPGQAGILSALVGSLWIMSLTALIAVPLGVASAVWLEEYARKGRLSQLVEVNISNLAGVPSIIYGLLGLGLFVRWLGLGRSIIAGALTLALLVVPVVIINCREALRAVPSSQREAAYGLGATRSQVLWNVVLPAAIPGTLTGVILALSRAIGETAPLITIGALTFIAFLPSGPTDQFTVLPIQIFNWVSRPQAGFHSIAASGIIVLLLVLLSMNAVAVVLRDRARRNVQW
jgi:phosphate transport system permease protein